MSPGLRKFVLTSHITFSVGWFGAVVTTVSVYKPWDKIKRPLGLYILLTIIGLILLIGILHLCGISLGGHQHS